MWDTILSVYVLGMVPAAILGYAWVSPPRLLAQWVLLTLLWPLWVAAYAILWLTAHLLPWLW